MVKGPSGNPPASQDRLFARIVSSPRGGGQETVRACSPERREALRARAYAAAAAVSDPEIPALSIADLGVLRAVAVAPDGSVEVTITPTYSGCPAMDVIAAEIAIALEREGIAAARIRRVLAPAWTTDWITAEGRVKLAAAGIAPPPTRAPPGGEAVACPRCGSERTETISRFGSTPCKALWRCLACREPFEAFKCL